METEAQFTVFYDGLCRLCSREIEHYRRQPGSEKMRFMDITDPNFDAAQEGVDPFEVHRVMHVRTEDGRLATRTQAFIEIWKRLPRYRGLGRVAEKPLVQRGLEVGYTLFARVRPYLPRRARAAACADSPYCEVKNA